MKNRSRRDSVSRTFSLPVLFCSEMRVLMREYTHRNFHQHFYARRRLLSQTRESCRRKFLILTLTISQSFRTRRLITPVCVAQIDSSKPIETVYEEIVQGIKPVLSST